MTDTQIGDTVTASKKANASAGFCVGDTVTTKKPHACGGDRWQIMRTGADYKLKCCKCGHIVMLTSEKFHKAVKQVGK